MAGRATKLLKVQYDRKEVILEKRRNVKLLCHRGTKEILTMFKIGSIGKHRGGFNGLCLLVRGLKGY